MLRDTRKLARFADLARVMPQVPRQSAPDLNQPHTEFGRFSGQSRNCRCRMIDHYTYRVTWSAEDGEDLGLCLEFRSLSWLAADPGKAFEGIRDLQEFKHGWASCATTQDGCIRILSQPSYPSPVSPGRAVRILSMATSAPHHEYWRSEISILDETIFDHSRIHGLRQITDVYLLGLAAHYGGRLVTFGRTIALSAVRTASPSNLVVL